MDDLLNEELKELNRRERKIPRIFGICFTLAVFITVIHSIMVLKTSEADEKLIHAGIFTGMSAFVLFLIASFLIAPFISLLLSMLIAAFILRERKFTQKLFMVFSISFLLLELLLLYFTIMNLANERMTIV